MGIRNAPEMDKSCAAGWVPLERSAISGAAPAHCIAAGCRKLPAGRRRSPARMSAAYVPSAHVGSAFGGERMSAAYVPSAHVGSDEPESPMNPPPLQDTSGTSAVTDTPLQDTFRLA